MIDEIRLTWAALHEAGPPARGDLAVRRLAVPDADLDVLLAIDGHRRGHLLLSSDSGVEDESLQSVRISSRQLVIDGRSRSFVDLVCETATLADVFDQYITAVLDTLRREPEQAPGDVALATLAAWRRFLVAGGSPVSPERLAPLFAELLVLASVTAIDPGALATWRGPGARHDFTRGDTALEVKSTRAHTTRQATIHGIDQLEAPEHGELFVEFIRLEEAIDGGESVPDLVDRIRDNGVPAEDLYAAVARGGLPAASYDEARHVRFTTRERLVLPVIDPFPRMVPASFTAGAPAPGIIDVVYRIDLDTVLENALEKEQVTALHSRLAGAST